MESNDERSFYDKIVGITEETAYKSVLIKHTDELYNALTHEYKENIKISAKNGYSHAIISLFNIHAPYRGKITVHDMLFPTDKFLRKCRKYNVDPILERIKKNLSPFEVKYEVMNSDSIIEDRIAAIIVYWKLPKDSDESSESSESHDSHDSREPINETELSSKP